MKVLTALVAALALVATTPAYAKDAKAKPHAAHGKKAKHCKEGDTTCDKGSKVDEKAPESAGAPATDAPPAETTAE